MEKFYNVLSESKAITTILHSKGKFVAHLGAGVSQSAGIPLAGEICRRLRENEERALQSDGLDPAEIESRLDSRLSWNSAADKYAQTLRIAIPSQDARIGFFQELLKDKGPTFSHFAIALLMDRGLINRSCLTTNFDKLVMSAFFGLGRTECQAIRTRHEVKYWDRADSCYCLMLHGDCDTRSIRNTLTEIGPLESEWRQTVKRLLKGSGLFVLGSGGHEESVYNLVQDITSSESLKDGVLGHGMLWGVHVGDVKDPEEELERVLEGKHVGAQIMSVMNREKTRDMPFAFFPVRSSDDFLYRLIELTGDRDLKRSSRVHLEHGHRVSMELKQHGFPEDFIRDHVDKTAAVRARVQQTGGAMPLHTEIVRADKHKDHTLVVAYGDITNVTLAQHPKLAPLRRAIVSSDDTYYTAGGGVALSIVERAGPRAILNELEKFPKPADPGDVLVTSSGWFLTQYIFHAAIVGLNKGGKGDYDVSRDHIRLAMRRVVEQMHALNVRAVYLPLLGSGFAGIRASESLADILSEIEAAEGAPSPSTFVVIIRNRADLSLPELEAACGDALDRFKPMDAQDWHFG